MVKWLARPIHRTVIVLDDIWTTGATMETAAKLLRSIGVQKNTWAGCVIPAQVVDNIWRKRRDSNPRRPCGLTAFESGQINHILHSSLPAIFYQIEARLFN